MSFQTYYRTVYETFGSPLTERQGMPLRVLTAAGKRLGVQIPAALCAYYLVAGNERRFNRCHNRLLAPQEWELDKQRLIFMVENQAVLWWAVSTRNPRSTDPPVWQGSDDEPITWVRERRRCSAFLAAMLHYQAVSGGFRFCGSATVPDEAAPYRFAKHGWTCYGEIGGLKAYSRSNQVVCLQPFMWPFIDTVNASVLAGAKTKEDLQAIGDDLGLTFE
jgi:hypothetical protein